ncbi:MAG: thiamine phosphate synthase [Gemmatimonadales bacterium]
MSDDRVAALDDLGTRAAAIAATGPQVALVARLPNGSTDRLASLAQRFIALAAPPMAAVMVTGRADVAMAVGADGVILRQRDLDVAVVSILFAARHRLIFCSVHSEPEAVAAVRAGADALIVGTIWPSATHSERPPAGTPLLERVVSLGVPAYAIGGVTAARAIEARAAGAWGVAAIGAVWDAPQPYRAAMELAEVWA